MKQFLIAGAGLALVVASGVYGQTRSDDNGEAIKRSLEEKAVRIPAQRPEAAPRSADSADTRRARALPRQPNWDEVRADLNRTAGEDAERNLRQDSLSTTRTGPPAPPPPGLRALAADRLATAERDEVDRVLIPVLLPAHPDVRDKLKVYGMENVYTATADIDDDASLSISGTCNRVIGGDPSVVEFRRRLSEQPRRLSGTRAAYHISRNDFGVDLSFSKFGCGYVMTIECGNPADDTRCAADDYISLLADSMILANPERAGGE